MEKATDPLAKPARPLSSPRTFPCESCGADLEFNIGAEALKCPYCGHVKALEAPEGAVTEQHYHARLERLRELRARDGGAQVGSQELTCGTCGATVLFEGALTSTSCAYCGSPLQRDRVHSAPERIAVDGILPFAIERESAREALARWVRSRWFAPNEFERSGAQGKFNGVYFPFWTFDSMTATRYVGERGDAYYVVVGSGKNRRRERRLRWSPARGAFQYFFDDVLVCAASVVQTKLLERLEPWPLGSARPFDPALVAGYAALTYDRELDQGFEAARARMDAALREEARRRIGGDAQRLHQVDSRFDAITYKHLLLPAWVLAYRFRSQTYQVVVNATTGEVSGERPYSAVKIALAALLAILAIATFAYFTH